MTTSEFSAWSCDPKDIPPWTEEDEIRLNEALGKVFGWKPEDVVEANRKVSERYTK